MQIGAFHIIRVIVDKPEMQEENCSADGDNGIGRDAPKAHSERRFVMEQTPPGEVSRPRPDARPRL